MMRIEFDPVKNEANLNERGLSFERVTEFDFSTARIWLDTRKPYTEARYLAVGYLDRRLHVLCFTFRKANTREGVKHGFALTHD
jgi:uncharacterized protein